jgi:N-methylhydantoinase A
MPIRIGIDVGGTFTDFIEIGGDSAVRIVKVPSVPASPAQGVMAGLTQLAESRGGLAAYMDGVDEIVHGTTITTNAVLTRRYAKTAYLTTKGFKDILNSRRGIKRSAFTAKEAPPEPIVPQYLVRTITGRLDKLGAEVEPLSEDDIRAAAAHFQAESVEAVAVCYMFAFLNPAHERRTREILQDALPGVYVTLSSEVLPKARLYERGSTTVFNAACGPLLRRYVDDLLGLLAQSGFRGRFLTMQSNGGVMTPEVVRDFAANTLLSGPASGPVAGLFFAEGHKLTTLITMDMGGTSLDVGLIRDGRAAITSNSEVAEYALAVPTLDINAIGAGGGSIAGVRDGVVSVGPDSAGADPGPASYSQGGERPTVTDANLVLGLLDPANFLGGRKRLDTDAAVRAIGRFVAEPLDLSIEQAALGIIRIINAKMADGVRAVSVSRGFDPRDACLVAGGGAGPLHACGIAEELGVGLILVPSASSVFCATGMLASHLRQDIVRHAAIRLSNGTDAVAQLNKLRRMLLDQGREILSRQGIPSARQRLEFSADMLFEGQFNALETRVAMMDGDNEAEVGEAALPTLRKAFETGHERVYGYVLAGEPVEIQSLRLSAIGLTEPLAFPKLKVATTTPDICLRGVRPVWSAYGRAEAPIYDGARLEAGHEISGPALIDHPTTTINVALGWMARMDAIGNLMMWRGETQLETVLARLRATRN